MGREREEITKSLERIENNMKNSINENNLIELREKLNAALTSRTRL